MVTGVRRATFRRAGNRLDWKIFDTLLIGEELILFGRTWVDLRRLHGITATMTRKNAQQAWVDLVNALADWSFKHRHDRDLVAGLIIATGVGSCELCLILVGVGDGQELYRQDYPPHFITGLCGPTHFAWRGNFCGGT